MTRRNLIDNLRSQHERTRARPATEISASEEPAHNGVEKGAARDFRTLPGYRAVQMAKAASAAMDLPSPFFREIEEVDGTRVRISGRWVENFASYDYLSLNQSDEIAAAVEAAVGAHGISATASRLVGGNHALHGALERALADFLGQQAALAFVSGHATNQAILRTLVGPRDLVAVDALAHNSVFEGIRISGARHITFPHNDWELLDRRLADLREEVERVLIVIEGLYSMDGDRPDLAEFVAVKNRHAAWLMVDEAHSLGVLGATGRGIREETGLPPEAVDITMGTLSKSLCSAGGFVAGSRELIDLLRYQAPGFVYSVGLSIPNTAAALAAVLRLARDATPVQDLRRIGAEFLRTAKGLGLDCGLAQGTAIAPILLGDSLKAVRISAALLERGFNVLPIIAPAVPERSARLRFFLNAGHSAAQVEAVLTELSALLSEAPTPRAR